MSKPSLRDSLRQTSQESLESLKAVDSKVSKDNDNSRPGFITIEAGVNRLRVFPSHPSESGGSPSFMVAKKVWWLPIKEKDKDGKVFTKRKPIFDATIHSKKGVDIVQTYMDFFYKKLKDEGLSSDEIKAEMKIIYGFYHKDKSKRVEGIVGKPTFIMYANKMSADNKVVEFGRVEVGTAVKNGINKIIATEAANEPIGSVSNNPLTDPDEARLLIIDYNKEATKPEDYYTTTIDTSFDRVNRQVYLFPLTDEDIEKFMEVEPLEKLYTDCYTKRDFDLALQGLETFDKEHKIGLFGYEDFVLKCEEIQELYPDPADEKEEESEVEEEENEEVEEEKPKSSSVRKFETLPSKAKMDLPSFDISLENHDAFFMMDRDAMEDFIELHDVPIRVRSSMSDGDLCTKLEEWEKENNHKEEPKVETKKAAATPVRKAKPKVEEEEEVEQEESEESDEEDELAKKIAAMRAKVGKK